MKQAVSGVPSSVTHKPSPFWVGWLLIVCIGVVIVGLALVFAPGLAINGFSLLVYGDMSQLGLFGQRAVHYISLAHAVLGGVMVGWGTSLVLVVRGPFAAGAGIGWRIVAASVLAWFVPDTAYSLWSGFWQNAALNLFVLVLFAIPLAATYRSRTEAGA